MKGNHNTNRRMNCEARLSVVYLTVVFLPGIEIAFKYLFYGKVYLELFLFKMLMYLSLSTGRQKPGTQNLD